VSVFRSASSEEVCAENALHFALLELRNALLSGVFRVIRILFPLLEGVAEGGTLWQTFQYPLAFQGVVSFLAARCDGVPVGAALRFALLVHAKQTLPKNLAITVFESHPVSKTYQTRASADRRV
jgi:hypothetical protein